MSESLVVDGRHIAVTNAYHISFYLVVQITQDPKDQDVALGKPVTFTITANTCIGRLSYQWQKDGNDLAGETDDQLTIPQAQLDDAGVYRCVVSNCVRIVCTSTNSQAARLSVCKCLYLCVDL